MKIKNGKIQIKNYDLQYWVLQGVILFLGIITIYSFTKLGLTVEKHNPIFDSHYYRVVQMLENFSRFNINFKKYFSTMIISFLSTFGLAFLSTILGLLIGGVLALFSARNLSNKWLSDIIRGSSAAVRAVPTFLIVLLCISIYGMTGTSAVIGMTFHSTVFFVKVLGETFEEVEEGTLEGIKASGGSWLNLIHAVVIPSSINKIVAWSAFRLEINFGVAVIMGPFAAVKNSLGSDLKKAVSTYNFTEIFFTIGVIFITMYVLQYLADRLKRKAKLD
ncbi:PhnE/PtxC family ABC transporter permease [Cetobacterium somerae]|uniref:PhnE/PtxC family ABC transporter permease n=1 Tax=Cetobacterium somerae TaxID=188913 RepID=UPI00248F1293|nr:ABC transporter permease subunit [Cetobacterium somerae]